MADSIELSGLSLAYPKTGPVLDEITHRFQPGRFTAILGPSGCGKSTLLRLIAGLEAPDRGTISAPNDSIGFVFQKPALLPWASALRNVALPSRMGTGDVAQASRLLGQVGLADSQDLKPHELSGGMQMRVSIARALMGTPRLLLLDEPFAALDSFTRQKLNDDLLSVWETSALTALFVTHSVTEAVYLADEIIVMTPRPGRILTCETVPFERPRRRTLLAEHAFQDFCTALTRHLEQALESEG